MNRLEGTPGWVVCCALAALAGCDRPVVHHAGPAKLSVSPIRVDFGLVWVGQPQSQAVIVSNDGETGGTAEVSITAPFTVDATSVEVAPGSHSTLTVRYDPARSGHDAGSLKIGAIAVPLTADARVIPECPASACEVAAFDTLSRSCTRDWKPDGTACQTACVSGSCRQGECQGSFDACDDSNACTADACAEPGGCSHTAIQCPAPADPCLVALCDPASGCGTTAAADGTACGDNLCTSSTMEVCISGQCVVRARPSGTRCGDTWVSAGIPARGGFGFAYDSDRNRLVLFGGEHNQLFGDTWEYDGTRWARLQPASAPPPLEFPAMTYDPVRHVTLMFGGNDGSSTWQWDGTTWTQLHPAHAPPGRNAPLLAFDGDRGVAVLFGGMVGLYNGLFSDTWEWDGTDWTQRFPSTAPPAREGHTIAYDPGRKRTVLFNGAGPSSDTWEWDGTSWTGHSTLGPPPAFGDDALVYDPARQSILFVGGSALAAGLLFTPTPTEIWEYTGGSWSLVASSSVPSGRTGAGVAFDPVQQRLLMFGGGGVRGDTSQLWQWNGAQWSAAGAPTPPDQWSGALTYDRARSVAVLFVDTNLVGQPQRPGETWEWDGTQWHQRLEAASPPSRTNPSLAYDSDRGVSVLFGGMTYDDPDGGTALRCYDETWEYDGLSWVQRTPAHAPSGRSAAAMAYDSVRKRMVLFGGGSDTDQSGRDDTWEYDGTDWTQVVTATSPSRRGFSGMAFDEARAQTVLFSGTSDTWGASPGPLNDTWLYDGTQWQQVSWAPGQPGSEVSPAMAYDSLRRQIVLYEWAWGTGVETWVWNGSAWSQRHPAASPSSNSGSVMTYDVARDEFVMFGGGAYMNWSTDDTWRYLPP